MTIELFIYLFAIGSTASSLLTQALKKNFKATPSSFIALISSLAVGLCGTIAAYILMGIPFDVQGITCILLMCVCIWVGCMCGYDKVLQLISQFRS